MKSLNKTETPIFWSVVYSLFPKAIILTFIWCVLCFQGQHFYILFDFTAAGVQCRFTVVKVTFLWIIETILLSCKIESSTMLGVVCTSANYITVKWRGHKTETSVFFFSSCSENQGPVVQSVVSLTSSLRVISLTVLADSIYNTLIFFAEKMWVAFALQKLLTFFQQKHSE